MESANSSQGIFLTATPGAPIPIDELDACERELGFSWPAGFLAFLAANGGGRLCGQELLAPTDVRRRTAAIGRKMRVYGLRSVPDSLASASFAKNVIVVGESFFCNPASPGTLYRLQDERVEEIGSSFAEFADWLKGQGGPQLRRLHFTPATPAGRRTKVLRSPRRRHCFDAVELMLTPTDPAVGQMLEHDAEQQTFLLGIAAPRGTIACSCQDELHQIILDYDADGDLEPLSDLLEKLASLGYEDPAEATTADEPGQVDSMAAAPLPNEEILAVLPDYALEKRVLGDLVFTTKRLLFLHRDDGQRDAAQAPLAALLAGGQRFDAHDYDDLKRLLIKRNLFGRSLVAVRHYGSGKYEFYGPKAHIGAALELAPQLRNSGVPVHSVS